MNVKNKTCRREGKKGRNEKEERSLKEEGKKEGQSQRIKVAKEGGKESIYTTKKGKERRLVRDKKKSVLINEYNKSSVFSSCANINGVRVQFSSPNTTCEDLNFGYCIYAGGGGGGVWGLYESSALRTMDWLFQSLLGHSRLVKVSLGQIRLDTANG